MSNCMEEAEVFISGGDVGVCALRVLDKQVMSYDDEIVFCIL